MTDKPHTPKLYTALLTPYNEQGKIDYKSVDKLLSTQSGIADGIVIMGTTQECTLLNPREKKQLTEYILNNCDKSLLKIVGIGETSTAKTVRNALKAVQQGAEALLVVTPYYSKCTNDGLVAHFEAVCKATELPVIIYNIPQRSGYDLSVSQLNSLATLPNVTAIKQCSDNYAVTKKFKKTSPHIQMLNGNDYQWHKTYKLFDGGLVSVLSNAVPQLTRKAVSGEKSALSIFTKLAKICALEVSPVIVKYLCYKLGLISCCNMRLPLTPPQQSSMTQIDNFVDTYKEQLV